MRSARFIFPLKREEDDRVAVTRGPAAVAGGISGASARHPPKNVPTRQVFPPPGRQPMVRP